MLRIAVVQFSFYPDISAVSQLLGDLLCKLADSGRFNITVYCATSAYAGVKNERDSRFQTLNIVRVRTPSIGGKGILSRALEYVGFYAAVFFQLLFHFNLDVVVSMSSPPLIALPVALAVMLKRARFLYYIEDLFPEILFDLGYVNRPWLIRRLQRLHQFAVRRADRIVTISEYMTHRVLFRYPEAHGKIEEIPNWAPGSPFEPPLHRERFTITYSGNMGLAHDFNLLKPLLHALRCFPEIRYRFVGGGARVSEVRGIFQAAGERRVEIHGYVNRERHRETLNAADAFIIAQRKESVGDLLPSKLYSYLVAGRPIIFLGPRNCEIGRLVINNEIGVVVEYADDVITAKRYVEFLLQNRQRAERLCSRIRALFDLHFGLDKSSSRFHRLLIDTARKPG